MLKKYLRQIEIQRKHSNQYSNKIHDDETLKVKNQAIKSAWFQENKDRIRQQQLERYKNADEYNMKCYKKVRGHTKNEQKV